MKMMQVQEELKILLKEVAPEFNLEPLNDRSCPTVMVCMGFINIDFAIDKTEWEKNTPAQRKNLVEARLLRMLRDTKLFINRSIKEINK